MLILPPGRDPEHFFRISWQPLRWPRRFTFGNGRPAGLSRGRVGTQPSCSFALDGVALRRCNRLTASWQARESRLRRASFDAVDCMYGVRSTGYLWRQGARLLGAHPC